MSTTAEQTKNASTAGELSLELTKCFEAKPERIFDAWLGDEWAKWVPPGGATCVIKSMQPKTGGAYVLKMNMPDGRDIEISGKYIAMERPNKLVMTWTGNYDGRETLLTVTLRSEGTGTLLTLRQEGFVEQQLQQGYIKGWEGEGGSFDKLAKLL